MAEPNRPAISLRERKKARCRRTPADSALRLFPERGYDAVTVAEIAEAAEVSVPTLFSYFRSKEALLFDLEPQIEAGLIAAVSQRPPDRDVLDAVHEYLLSLPPLDPRQRDRLTLTPGGSRRLTDVAAHVDAFRKLSTTGISLDEYCTTVRVLERMSRNLETAMSTSY